MLQRITNMFEGNISKMAVEISSPVQYQLRLGDQRISLNPHISQQIQLRFSGQINCVACGRQMKKSFNQGYCFPCTKKLAECDICIVRPEKCHFDAGTCRDEEWAKGHCFEPHYVYLANSSGVKVGITRASQIPTRWIDQGATQALPVFRAKTRFQVGLLEVAIAEHVTDKTDWRKMLKGDAEAVDLVSVRDTLLEKSATAIKEIEQRFPGEITFLADEKSVDITFPVQTFPQKITSLNFDKTPEINGTLLGIKGQYLILDNGVLNIRKFGGYQIAFEGGAG